MLNETKSRSEGKTSIIIAIILGLSPIGCSTYLSLTKNNEEQVVQKLRYDDQDENVGAEVTLLKKNSAKIKGELLSVREYAVTICTKLSATEVELANMSYPITTVQNEKIQEVTIEGSNCVWIGFAVGAATFTGIGIWIGHEYEKGLDTEGGKEGFGIIGFLVGAIVGGIVGYLLSTDDVILHEFPPGYDFSLLKPLARYPSEEPEYLRAIK